MVRHAPLFLVALLFLSVGCGSTTDPSEVDPPIGSTPDYAGSWNGSYAVTSCTQTGQMASADLCGTTTAGTVLPHRFEFTQTGRNLSGQFYLGSILFTFSTVAIANNGSVVVQGIAGDSSISIVATWTLAFSNGSPSGTVVQSWTAAGFTGVTTISGSTTTTTGGSGGSGGTKPATRAATLQGLVDALRRR